MKPRLRLPLAWLAARHSLWIEAAAVVILYALYEATRGLVAGDPSAAVHHAQLIASYERSAHVFVEADVQRAAQAVPGLVRALGFFYLTLHLGVTIGYLLWLHRRRPEAFPLVRTALFAASALALIGYVAFPTAPPRMAAIGIGDTLSRDGIDLNHGLISSLYNPFAAVPSIHICYALIIGVSLIRFGRRPSLRIAGVLYPALVLTIVVATGNHFFFDALAGAAVAAAGLASATLVARQPARVRWARPSTYRSISSSNLASASTNAN
jgi:PAP2 superfamily